jgi:predicted nucleic acid-binding protein
VIVVDSSVWVDYLNSVPTPQTQQLDRLLDQAELLMGDLILCEILQGLRSEREAALVLDEFGRLPCVSMVGRQVAVTAAANYRLLRRLGVTIRKEIDLLIGTFCIVERHALLHNDKDFRPMREHLGLMEA